MNILKVLCKKIKNLRFFFMAIGISVVLSTLTSSLLMNNVTYVSVSDEETKSLMNKIRDCSVMITTPYSSGSGVVIEHRDGFSYILTARHVVEMSPSFINIHTDSLHELHPGLVVAMGEGCAQDNWACDWAVVRVAGLVGAPVGRCETPEQFEKVYMGGYPLGITTATITRGDLMSDVGGVLRVTSNGVFGSSGGGIFVVRGGEPRLIGVAIRIYMVNRYAPIYFLMAGNSVRNVGTY